MCLYVFVDCKCKSSKRLGEHIKQKQTNINKQTQNRNNFKTNIEQLRNTGFPAHEPPRKINISKGMAGRFQFLFVCFCLRLFVNVFLFFKCFP